jgi:hypothetical protein
MKQEILSSSQIFVYSKFQVDQKVVDFDQLEDHRIAFDGADFAICCLGTTR